MKSMTDKAKIFTLAIKGDTSDVEKQLKVLAETSAKTGLRITETFSRSDETLKQTATTVRLVADQLKSTKTVADAFNKAFDSAGLNKYFINVKTGLAEVDRLLKSVGAKGDLPAQRLLSTIDAKLKAFQDAAKLAQRNLSAALSAEGTSTGARKATAQEELRIRQELAAKVKQLENDIKNEVTKNIGAAQAARTGAFNQAKSQILELRSLAEIKLAAEREQAARAKQNMLEEKAMLKEIAVEEKRKFADRKRFYLEWINDSHRLHQQEIADTKRKNAQIRADTLDMYRDMFAQIERKEKEAAARSAAARNSALVRGMSNQPSLHSLLLTGGMSQAGRVAAGSGVVPPIIPPRATADVNDHSRAIDRLSLSHRTLLGHVASVILEYRVLNSLINSAQQALRNIPKAGIEQQATQAAVQGIFGTEEGNKNLEMISVLADRAGQSLTALEQSYRRYAPAAALAGGSQEAINKSFSDFAETSTILHLTQDKLTSLFLALEQMYSKGTVQSEEIKKQLGNVLPGAVEIGAKAMEMLPSKFMEAMKKNEVTAKEFIPKFAALYRKLFGGEDDKIFLSVTNKLLSNYTRLQNEYERVNRAIFTITEGAMNKIVRIAGDALTTVKENLSGIGQSIEIVASLLIGRLSIALIATAASATKAALANFALLNSYNAISYVQGRVVAGTLVQASLWTRTSTVMAAAGTSLAGLVTRLTGLSVPVLAGAAAITTLFAKLNELSFAYEEATGFMVKFRDEQVSLVNYLQGIVTEVLDGIQKAYRNVMKSVSEVAIFIIERFVRISEDTKAAIRQAGEALGNAFKDGLLNSILPSAQDYAEFKAALNTFGRMASEASMKLPDSQKIYNEEIAKQLEASKSSKPLGFETALKEDVIDTLEKLSGKTVLDVQEAIAKGYLTKAEDITKALANTLDTAPAPGLFGGQDLSTAGVEANSKKAEAAAAKARRDLYKDIARDTKGALREIELGLKELEIAYSNNVVSIQDYYDKKQAAMQKSEEEELLAAEKSRMIAEKSGDAAKAEEFNDKFADLNNQYLIRQIELTEERSKATKEFKKQLEEVRIEYLRFIGDTQGAAAAEYALKTADLAKKVAAEAASGNAEAQKAQEMLKFNEQAFALQEQLTASKSKYSIISDNLANKELQIQAAKNIGAKSELQALYELQEARQDAIKLMEEQLVLQEQLLATGKLSPEVAQGIKNARAQLEAFKIESQLVSSYFQNIVTQNFANSFAAFVDGSKSAGQAFQDFAKGVINQLAQIAAQEAATQIFSFLKMGVSAFTSSFGGAALPSAKGNVFSGGNVVPFARGGIPDIGSKKQYFPLANGGIGSLRENGPEAILPLKRDSKGMLGVRLVDSGTKGGNVYNISVVTPAKDKDSADEFGAAAAKAIMRQIAREEITTAARPGNTLNRTTKVA